MKPKNPASHLYIATNVRSADPGDMRALDLTGATLRERLKAKKERRYFEAPIPVAVYDDLLGDIG